MRTLEQNFVPYEIASELKDLGFDEPCFGYYLCKNSAFGIYIEITSNWLDLLPYDSSSCKAPLYQQALEFFRDKYKLKFYIREDIWNHWCSVTILEGEEYTYIGEYETYEEAQVECLKKLIEIVKEKK